MIFVDTSAVFALASDRDQRHLEARISFDTLLRTKRRLLTHSYVLSESMTLLHQRLGHRAASAFAAEVRNAFEVEWVAESLHNDAVDALRSAPGGVSLVDQVSFLVMRERRIVEAFAFDTSFIAAGFRLYSA